MKFDIFNQVTWDVSFEDKETILRNKALGSIGQLIGEIRILRDEIEMKFVNKETPEFLIAKRLKQSNPEAFRLMQVEILYPDSEINVVMSSVDRVLEFWKDINRREADWRSIFPILKNLQPLLQKRNDYFSRYGDQVDAIAKLTRIKVTGNAAWDVYFLDLERSRKLINELYEKHPESNPLNSPINSSNLYDEQED